ncbi:NAD-dependent epimerase/dehydratase family protein [Herbiconiux moechotypicola]|uniref:Aldehyde reductase n=1 Tax=Herbiconiux moechotypicola TaxID=637393 RepID=A0ABN3E4S8_9MICO|nr:NAD-dependent epimerase/dehydratase family protein [Herbiconiux moechotypicola]MCS5731842.1 NAD-dependent epimerase/dehydratase family protein [Herbiconiux moechotypicola]
MTHSTDTRIHDSRIHDSRILVTGGSGFIAGHCILQLLQRGDRVRTTVRDLGRVDAVRTALAAAGAGPEQLARLEFAAADLFSDDGWGAALEGVDGVLHVASPVHPGPVDDEDELIVPARDGALRVLRAARAAGVRRVVLTSAFHAVGWGHPHDDHVFTEDDWTVLDGPGVDAYGRSKTLAERAAWEFAAEAGDGFELATVLPVAVMGPVLGGTVSGANHIVQRLLAGAVPAYPDLWFPIVDVRDVAAAHILALIRPEAAGRRFLLASDPAMPMKEIGALLREALGAAAAKVPTRSLPSAVVRASAVVSPEMRAIVPDLGYARRMSSGRARTLLGWVPRPSSEAVVAAGRSLTSS